MNEFKWCVAASTVYGSRRFALAVAENSHFFRCVQRGARRP